MKKITIEYYIIVFGIFILLPFLLLCFYNHPATDDFDYTNVANKYGFYGAQAYWYKNWAGCLLPSMQMSGNPLMFYWFFGFKLIPFVYFFVFIFALYFFIHTICGSVLAIYQKWAIVFSIIFVYLFYVPLVSHGFFWLTGLATYQTPAILTLLLFSVLFKIKYEKKKNSWLRPLAIILVILITQASETYMVLILGLLSCLIFFLIVFSKRIDHFFPFLMVVALIAALLVLFSPGMWHRVRVYSDPSLSSTDHLIITLRWVSLEIAHFIFSKSLLLIIFFLILLPVFDSLVVKFKNTHGFSFPLPNPIFIFLSTIVILSIVLFPICWFYAYVVGRVANVAYFYFVLGMLYSLLCFWNYIKSKHTINLHGKIYKGFQGLLFVISVMMLMLPNNIRVAYGDILLGRGALYNDQLNTRYKLIEASKTDTCTVPPLEVYPVTISYMDMSENPAEWVNQGMSVFFNKKAVMLSSSHKEEN